MKHRIARRSPLAVALLGLLVQEPLHPYRMQQRLKEYGKDEVVNIRDRASIYQTVERLLREGLIAVAETERDERWPERTIYQLTDVGLETLLGWLREMIALPAREYPEFPVALAYLPMFHPTEALQLLESRIVKQEGELARIGATMASAGRNIPRLFLIEDEYRVAVLRAELNWLHQVTAELRSGDFTWSEEQLRAFAAMQDVESPGWVKEQVMD